MVFVQKSEYFSFNLMLSHFFFSSFNRFQMNVISLCTWQKFKSNLQASKKKFLFHYVQSTDLPSLTTNLANSKRKFTHILKNRSGNSYILKYFIEKKKSSSSKDKKKSYMHLHILLSNTWVTSCIHRIESTVSKNLFEDHRVSLFSHYVLFNNIFMFMYFHLLFLKEIKNEKKSLSYGCFLKNFFIIWLSFVCMMNTFICWLCYANWCGVKKKEEKPIQKQIIENETSIAYFLWRVKAVQYVKWIHIAWHHSE